MTKAPTEAVLLKEFDVLRNEILKRTELQAQMVNLTLPFAALYISVTLEKAKFPLPLLVFFPILVVFLALAWVQNNAGVCKIGRYIRNHLEPKTGLGYESYRHQARQSPAHLGGAFRVMDGLGNVSATGVFVGVQIVSTLAAIYTWQLDEIPKALWLLAFALDVGAIAGTVYLMRVVVPQYWRMNSEPWEADAPATTSSSPLAEVSPVA